MKIDDTTIAIIKHLLANDIAPGSTTPSLMMGKDFACGLEGSSDISIARTGPADSE